jgi:hypothetical protein
MVKSLPDGACITCIGRTLINLLKWEGAIQRALERGLKLRLACWDPDPARVAEAMWKMTRTPKADFESGHFSLGNVIEGVITNLKCKDGVYPGHLELRYHDFYLPDTLLAYTGKDLSTVLWTLSFETATGRKTTFRCKGDSAGLGDDLCSRYERIWEASEVQFVLENGKVTTDKIGLSEA